LRCSAPVLLFRCWITVPTASAHAFGTRNSTAIASHAQWSPQPSLRQWPRLCPDGHVGKRDGACFLTARTADLRRTRGRPRFQGPASTVRPPSSTSAPPTPPPLARPVSSTARRGGGRSLILHASPVRSAPSDQHRPTGRRWHQPPRGSCNCLCRSRCGHRVGGSKIFGADPVHPSDASVVADPSSGSGLVAVHDRAADPDRPRWRPDPGAPAGTRNAWHAGLSLPGTPLTAAACSIVRTSL
jgi:hypothetical protein